jgi:hypothetical protein
MILLEGSARLERRGIMEPNYSPPTTRSLRLLSIGSILFALAGGAFSWWLPMGTIFSLTGLVLGFVDWVSSRRRSRDFRLALVGMALAVLTLALTLAIAAMGWQTVTFDR